MTLKRGSKGTAVRRLQRKLTDCRATLRLRQVWAENDPGDSDGIFGSAVEASVIWFQSYFELAPDGVAGGDLWLALLSIVPDEAIIIAPLDQLKTSDFTGLRRSMARIHNKYGAYLERAAEDLGVAVEACAGVLKVESGGKAFTDAGMIVRFENHVFLREWLRGVKDEGKRARIGSTFAARFEVGSSWKGHKFKDDDGEWGKVHIGQQSREWEVFRFARTLDEDAAIKSISMGLAQIMGFNYRKQGFATPLEMFDAMSSGVGAQLDGLFAFIENTPRCLSGLIAGDYVRFASGYNGKSRAELYGKKIKDAASAYAAVIKTL